MEGEGDWHLEHAIVGKGSGRSDVVAEEETEWGEAYNDTSEDLVDEVEVVRKGIANEEQNSLKHEEQTFHHKIEVPSNHSVGLMLSMPTAVSGAESSEIYWFLLFEYFAWIKGNRGYLRSTRFVDMLL